MQTTICKQSLWPLIAFPAYLQGITLLGIRCYDEIIYFTIIIFHVMIYHGKYNQQNDVVVVLSLQKPNTKGVVMKIFLLL